MKIFTPYLFSLMDYAAYQNIDTAALKEDLESQDIDLENPDEMINAEVYLTLFNKIIKATHNKHCGLSLACYLNLKALGLVLEISLNTSSVEQGVLILQKFLNNKFPLVSVTVIQNSESYILQLDCPLKDSILKRHLSEMVLGIIYRELRLMLPGNYPPQVRLPFTDSKPINDLLQTEVFIHTNPQIVLPQEIVNIEINKSKVREIQLLLPKFIAMLNSGKANDSSFAEQIHSMTLNMCGPEIPSFDQVQKQFPYSKRTMQRKLTMEGKSFRGIANAIKKELSNFLIREKHLKTKDVAYMLGYSEPSAYLHAVKSWKMANK